jgi:MFS family permease
MSNAVARRNPAIGSRLGANYWRLWIASVVSNFGDGIAGVAYPWLASAITRDPIQIALIGVANRLPWLLFSLPAGVLSDRLDRRKIVAAMDVFRFLLTLAVGLVVFAGREGLASPADISTGTAGSPPNAIALLVLLYGSSLLFGFAEVLRDNAAQTLMPGIVEPERLETANGRLWGAEMVMNSFIGPPVGGLLIAAGFAVPFFVDAGTFAFAAALIFLIAGSFRPSEAPAETIRWRAEISEGVGWLWNHRLLRSMALILGVMNAMLSMAMATYVLFVQEILELEAAQFGLLMTAGALGGVIGSLLATRVGSMLGRGTSLFVALLGSAVALGVTGATSSAIVVWAMFVASSFLAVVWNVITVSLRQAIIPNELLGRVNSVYRLLAWGVMPIGIALGGAIVSLTEAWSGRELGLRMPFYVAAAAFLILYVVALPRLNTRKIEEARRDAGVIDAQSGP